jgi:hypothetical protein
MGYCELQQVYDHFNAGLLSDELPDVVITLQRQANSYGHFSPHRFSSRSYKNREDRGRGRVARHGPDIVREAVAALADAGHAADVDTHGAHFKIRRTANGRHHLLVVSRLPSDHSRELPRHVATASGRALAMRPGPKPSFARSAAHHRHVVEVRLAAGIRCRCGRELRANDFEVDALRVHAICRGCDQDILTIERER